MILVALIMMQGIEDQYVPRELREQDVLAFEQASYDKELLQHTRVILGKLGGHMVVADFPCSDVCPNYTTRIIHYDVPVGPECGVIGGVEREAMVPHGVAVSRQRFCVPKALSTQLIREGS